MRVNGKRAIGIGVASGAKDNVVAVGKAVDARLAEIEQLLPIGIELTSLYPEELCIRDRNYYIIRCICALVIGVLLVAWPEAAILYPVSYTHLFVRDLEMGDQFLAFDI